MKLKIRYKFIEHERLEDAPFIGALVSSIDCNFNCKNCFNQHIKDLPILESYPEDIIKEIKSNPFNKGIIFGGMEWTNQLEELYILTHWAKYCKLSTILFTGLSDVDELEDLCIEHFNPMIDMPNELINSLDYIKCGRYEESLKCNDNIQYGIKLATSNQRIYKKGIDY